MSHKNRTRADRSGEYPSRSDPTSFRFVLRHPAGRRAARTLLAATAILGVSVKLAAGVPATPPAPAVQPPATEHLQYYQCIERRLRALENQSHGRAEPTANAPAATDSQTC